MLIRPAADDFRTIGAALGRILLVVAGASLLPMGWALLGAEPIRDPPGHGMEKEHGFDDALQHIDDVVVTPDVRQLMGDDRPELGWRDSRQDVDRYEDGRARPTDNRRHVDQG